MAKKIRSLDNFTIVAIVMIAIVALYFIYIFVMGLIGPEALRTSSLGEFKEISRPVINNVAQKMNACGNWPINNVSLSSGRGNPFNRKEETASQMTATATAYCLPVTQ